MMLSRDTLASVRRFSVGACGASTAAWIYNRDDLRFLTATVLTLAVAVFCWFQQSKLSQRASQDLADGRLQELVGRAEHQSQELNPLAFQRKIADVIRSFAKYAKLVKAGDAGRQRIKAAKQQLRVLAAFLETPLINDSCNYGWSRDWERACHTDSPDIHEELTVLYPTIIAAADSAGYASSGGPSSITHLADSCRRLLNKPAATDFLQRWEEQGVSSFAEDTDSPGGYNVGPQRQRVKKSSSKKRSKRASNFCIPGFCLGRDVEASSSSSEGEETLGTDLLNDITNAPIMNTRVSFADPTVMMVRGRKYLKDGCKVFSKSAMLECMGVHRFNPAEPVTHYAACKDARTLLSQLRAAGDTRFMFIVNWLISPNQVVAVFAVPDHPEWSESPEGRLWSRFIHEMSDEERNRRVKLIPRVIQAPWLVKQALPEMPSLIGKKIPITWLSGPDYLEASIDCIPSEVARRTLRLMQGACKEFAIAIYMLIEALEYEELPERILASFVHPRTDMPALPEM
eukprot:TRINITY_DN24133_c0_g1_i1.p1 TRINITY_DN24133_c0_g1~~TRINITY_DN24133_c0_g1_i1.p1  ORF type:complete len:514 (-),score=80.38 TRINITY_DN24133_c0_g1_i1:225-1766(-)